MAKMDEQTVQILKTLDGYHEGYKKGFFEGIEITLDVVTDCLDRIGKREKFERNIRQAIADKLKEEKKNG